MTAISEPEIPGFYRWPYTFPRCRPFCRLVGGGEAVLFVHGFTGSPADFRGFSAAYAEAGFDVYVPLMPGHGSHACFLETLGYRELAIPFRPVLRRLAGRYARTHLAGLSYGAVVAADLALAGHGDSLSLFGSAFYLSEERERGVRWVKRMALEHVRGRLRKPGGARLNEDPDEPAYRDAPLKPLVALYDRAAALRPRLAELRQPVFAAHGDRDEATPFERNRAFLRTVLPEHVFFRVPGAQHVLPLEPAHALLARAHIDWLKGLSA